METEKIKIDGVTIWKKSFESTLRNKKGFARRLKELKTWDKPLNPKSNDPNFKWAEWAKKVQALEELLED